jgi:hypothetical protein
MNEAVCGCSSPDERRESACEDEGEEAKTVPAPFSGLVAFFADEWTAERREEAFSADDRLEQPSGTKEATGERPLNCP